MKKTLLLAVAAAFFASAQADKYQILPSFALQGFSPNGNYAVSVDPYGGSLILLNLVDGTSETFTGDGYTSEYTAGIGVNISNNGILVGSDTPAGSAVYLENGVWKRLPVINEELTNLSNGISADGTVICGNLGNTSISPDAATVMCIPCVWYRQADGTYSEPVLLPHPDTDFNGRVPQYITASSISADGKVVCGQIRDYVGMIHEPIVYICDDKGEWSYKLIGRQFINPNKIEIPADPGDSPQQPSLDQFMSDADLDAYNEAMSKWDGNYANYPNMLDYISPEGLAAYDAAMDEFEPLFNKWMEDFDDYMAAYQATVSESKAFLFNCAYISPDGKKYLTSTESAGGGIWMAKKKQRRVIAALSDVETEPGFDDEPEEETEQGAPFVIDVDDSSSWTCSSEKGIQASYIADDYTVLGTHDFSGAATAVVLTPNASEYQTLEDYLATFDPEASTWMNENMRHDVESYDYATGEMVVLNNVMLSGVPYGTPDLSVIGTVANNMWDYESDSYIYSYILKLNKKTDSADTIGADAFAVKVLDGATVCVEGQEALVEIYNAAGQKVYTATFAGAQTTGLPQGLYIVKATAADGRTATLKAAF